MNIIVDAKRGKIPFNMRRGVSNSNFNIAIMEALLLSSIIGKPVEVKVEMKEIDIKDLF